ncbi:MAG TPA: hypothetical protein VN626_09525 [Clostridia bacterium]|nr:hypothetical protein [Clostridia bacterium]
MTFTSDFVPLIKLGSIVTVIRIIGEKRLECFVGKVYLSSRKLIRIVDINSATIGPALKMFESNAVFRTEFLIAPGATTRFNVQKARAVSGFVRYISPQSVKICTMEFVDKDEYLMFSLEESSLSLDKMLVHIKERILLMRSAALLLCEVVSLSMNNGLAIASYMNDLKTKEEQEQ